MMRILMIEDDKKLSTIIEYRLQKEGYILDICSDGEDGLRWGKEQIHDLIILDRMLPSLDGIEVLKRLRESKITIPVLMLTALGSLHQKIEGLDFGADDYMVKPFEMEELLARIRAMTRRPTKWDNTEETSYDDFTFQVVEKRINGKKGSCSLSKKESELLEFFIKNQGQILPRGVLLSRVWGPDAGVEDGSLDTYIYFLRNRLKSIGSSVQIIVERGVGYRMEKGN